MSAQTELSLSHSSSSRINFVDSRVNYIHNLPDELLLEIFNSLDFKDCLAAKKICRNWRTLASDPTIIHRKSLQEVSAIKNLSCVRPNFSAWESMPRHWGLCTKESVLKFSSIDRDIIAFHPPFCTQSSKFFCFSQQLKQSISLINDQKIDSVYKQTIFGSASGEVGIEATFGGKKAPEVSIYAKGEVKDNKGNFGKGEIKLEPDGSVRVKANAGHEEKDKN